MNKSAFNTARAKLCASAYALSYRDEEPDDAEKIRAAMAELREYAKGDDYWTREVEKLAIDVMSFPIFSSDPRERSRKYGYVSIVSKLESWAHSFPA